MHDPSKNHHYVPQAVLREFSIDKARKAIYVFDKTRLTAFRSSITNAGSENQFNTVEIDGRALCFERVFQENDSTFARLIAKILGDESLQKLNDADRVSLSEVVATQILRTKMARTSKRQLAEDLAESVQNAGIDPSQVSGLHIPTEQDTRLAALFAFRSQGEIVQTILRKKAVLIKNDGSSPFWISDNPVVTHNGFPYGNLGLNDRGIEMYFPISPEFALGFWCSSLLTKMKQLLTSRNSQTHNLFARMYERIYFGNPFPLLGDGTSLLNYLQVACSSRFLYSPSNDFSLAQRVLDENDDLRNIQSLRTVGPLGMGPPPAERMPSGTWVVFFGRTSHHMVKADSWDNWSEYLEFDTSDLGVLNAVLQDQPIESAKLFHDRCERRGILHAKIDVIGTTPPVHVRLSFRDNFLNVISRDVMDRMKRQRQRESKRE